MPFQRLGLTEPLCRAVAEAGYEEPTPIQRDAIPPVLAGRDLLGCAQTGTGKTAAFALPTLQRLTAPGPDGAPPAKARASRPHALILTPTRELALQIDESFRTYGKHLGLRCAVIFGGVGQSPQEAALRSGVDILTATPGRLLDLMGQGLLSLDSVKIFVLDEADRMLDMGFLPDVRKVLTKLPVKRQSLFFSATMPPSIVALADTITKDPVQVEVVPQSTPAERITQRVLFVDAEGKRDAIAEILSHPKVGRALVFTRTKHGANRLVERLLRAGIKSAAIHGNKSQSARVRALEGFRTGECPVLVATDLAARGLDVEGVTHVINYELPNIPESYVHRIGRTARAGASGVAVSLCDPTEIPYLRDIEKLIGQRIPVGGDRIGLPAEVRDPGPIGSRPSRLEGGGSRDGGGQRPGGGGRGGGGGGGGRGRGRGPRR